MARKELPSDVEELTEEAVELWHSTAEVKHEMARAAYNAQDKKTKAAIDNIWNTLTLSATGYIEVQLMPPRGSMVPVKVDSTYLGYTLFWLAVEIVKNLAIVDFKVESFEFPPSLCSKCGSEVIPELKSGKKAGRGRAGG